jgi:hypothetical protein
MNEQGARELARQLGNLVNPMNSDREEGAFLDELQREHRTLQQSVGKLLAQHLVNMGEPGMARFTDLRNEDLHRMGKVIREALEKEGFLIDGRVWLRYV